MRSPLFFCLLLCCALAGCDGWTVQPITYNFPSTTIPSETPSIHTATPVVLPPGFTSTLPEPSNTPTVSSLTATPMEVSTITSTPTIRPTTPTLVTVPYASLQIDILGCNTGFDITHVMGEVTNAYITISNLSAVEIDNVCTTLRGQYEGRPHPDKTKCLPSLPGRSRVTLKLTIDTTYRKDSPIQVDISSNNVLLQRLGKDSCSDIGLFPPDIDDMGVIKPIP